MSVVGSVATARFVALPLESTESTRSVVTAGERVKVSASFVGRTIVIDPVSVDEQARDSAQRATSGPRARTPSSLARDPEATDDCARDAVDLNRTTRKLAGGASRRYRERRVFPQP
jgi:hypothetical protein